MDCTTALGCLGKYVLIALAIFGVLSIISIQYSRRFNAGVKAAVEQQPEPKEGRIILREVVEGMNGMEDSYIAEIRDHGDGDARLHIYNVIGHQIMEAPLNKCCGLGLMMISEDIKKKHKVVITEQPKEEAPNPEATSCLHRRRHADIYSTDVICADCGARFVHDGLQLKPKGEKIERTTDKT